MTPASLVVCFNLPLLSTLSVLVCCFEFIMVVRFCYHQNYPEMRCGYFGRSYPIWSVVDNTNERQKDFLKIYLRKREIFNPKNQVFHKSTPISTNDSINTNRRQVYMQYHISISFSIIFLIFRWETHLYMSLFPSVRRAPYFRNCTSCDHCFLYTFVK